MAETARGRGSAGGAGDGEEGFDLVIERLRGVVEKLETGSLTLEQSLAAFEEGVRLSRRGAEILDAAERRVEVLLKGEDGGIRTAPFQSEDEYPGARGRSGWGAKSSSSTMIARPARCCRCCS